jgi:hypothetical protein
MDPIKNPFSPGAGAPPPELVGRGPILEQARILLGRVKIGRPEKSLLLIGLRGVGKTVLLNEIRRMAAAAGYHTIEIEVHEGSHLGTIIAPPLRKLLFELDRAAGAGDKAKRALRVLRSFLGGLTVKVGDVSIGLDIDPEPGTADSGNLEIDFPNLLVAVGEAAQERKSAVAILIDEVQYFDRRELGALIMAMHKMQQQRLPVVFVGGGKSYAERLFSFPEVGALSEEESAKALRDPARAAGVAFEPHALKRIFRLTRGYPYFLQEWGYQSWNMATGNAITGKVVRKATTTVTARLDQNFFRVRFDRLTPRERRFLRAMAELGPGPHRSGDIAESLRLKVTAIGPVRAQLIEKGMIYSPTHGDLAFTVPLFDEFMKRAVPTA